MARDVSPGIASVHIRASLALDRAMRTAAGIQAVARLPGVRRLAARAAAFAGFWVAFWWLQYELAPHWLVASHDAVVTVLQILPAVLFAALAVTAASLYLVGQQAANAYGNRAVVVLTSDAIAARLVIRSVLLVLASLLLSGQVPNGQPGRGLSAATETLLVASAVLVVRSVNTLGVLLGTYLAPRGFVIRCLHDLPREIASAETPTLDARTTALGEMLRIGIARHEFNTVDAAADGIAQIVDAYCLAFGVQPRVRDLPIRDGGVAHGWLGPELATCFVASGEAVLAGASQAEYQRVVDLIDSTSRQFAEYALVEETEQMIHASIALATSPHQIRPETINIWSQGATTLAMIEGIAESQPTLAPLVARALSGWALAVAYTTFQFGYEHPGRIFNRNELGPHPPWDEALAVVRSSDWQRRWANKIGKNLPVVELVIAEERGMRSQPAS